MEPNGSYAYTIATSNHEYGAYFSSVTVNGSAISTTVIFRQLISTVTFTESGLPSGSTWYLNLSDGKTLSSNSTTITVSLVNGTYSYTATSNGFQNKTGSVTLNDSNQSITITFTRASPKTFPANLSSNLIYIAVGVVAAVVIIGAAGYAITRKK